MNTLENASLFSDLSTEESVDINGGASNNPQLQVLLVRLGASNSFLGKNNPADNAAIDIINQSVQVVVVP